MIDEIDANFDTLNGIQFSLILREISARGVRLSHESAFGACFGSQKAE